VRGWYWWGKVGWRTAGVGILDSPGRRGFPVDAEILISIEKKKKVRHNAPVFPLSLPLLALFFCYLPLPPAFQLLFDDQRRLRLLPFVFCVCCWRGTLPGPTRGRGVWWWVVTCCGGACTGVTWHFDGFAVVDVSSMGVDGVTMWWLMSRLMLVDWSIAWFNQSRELTTTYRTKFDYINMAPWYSGCIACL